LSVPENGMYLASFFAEFCACEHRRVFSIARILGRHLRELL
jgi:hypothetical protein